MLSVAQIQAIEACGKPHKGPRGMHTVSPMLRGFSRQGYSYPQGNDPSQQTMHVYPHS